MTLQEALSKVDELKDNMMLTATKIGFINEIEGIIHDEIVMKHEHTPEQEVCPVYDDATDTAVQLIAPDRFAMLYVYFVMSKIDMENRETEEENNNRARFENKYRELQKWWIRNHMPLPKVNHFII